jgi:hypothetical protein
MIRTVFYGRMEQIIQYKIPDTKFWGIFRGKTRLLAVITPCITNGQDATKHVTSYTDMTTQIVTDLQAVQCVVGRVRTRNRWGIVDRSGDYSRTEFIPSNIREFSLSEDEISD